MIFPDEEIKLLCARIDDLISMSERGACVYSKFLSPRERHYAEMFIGCSGVADRCVFFGGCPGCERTRLFVLPDYFVGLGDLCDICADEVSAAVVCLAIDGNGFGKRQLTHRDYLGACLGLGITRDKLGDIAVLPDDNGRSRAFVFCERVTADFICESLSAVGSEGVKCRIASLPEGFEIKPDFEHISGTVASARLDCIVAEITNLSRDRAQNAIEGELVEAQYETCTKPDKIFNTPFTLSVRGYGKFIIRDCSEQTKKGRYRLIADKYK